MQKRIRFAKKNISIHTEVKRKNNSTVASLLTEKSWQEKSVVRKLIKFYHLTTGLQILTLGRAVLSLILKWCMLFYLTNSF